MFISTNPKLKVKTLAKMLLGWQLRTIFDKLESDENSKKNSKSKGKNFNINQKVYFKQYIPGKKFWELGVIVEIQEM